jgi:hypothetical protein
MSTSTRSTPKPRRSRAEHNGCGGRNGPPQPSGEAVGVFGRKHRRLPAQTRPDGPAAWQRPSSGSLTRQCEADPHCVRACARRRGRPPMTNLSKSPTAPCWCRSVGSWRTVGSPDRIRTGATALRGTGRYLTRWPADVQLRCQRVIPRQARGHASGTTPPLPLRCTAAHRERAPKSRAPRSSSSPTTSRARTCEQVHAARCRQARPARPSRTTRQDTETPWTLAPAGSYHACP